MENKIKVVHYLPNLVNGGIERMLLNYYQELKDLFEFVVVIHENPVDSCVQEFKKMNIKIYQIEHWIRNPIKNFKELRKILKDEKPDIFHTHHNLNNFIPCFVALIAGTKIRISHCHAYFPKKTYKQKFYSILTRLFATDLAACGIKAAEFMTNPRIVKKNKVKIIYNAIDLEKFKYSEQNRKYIRQKHGWKKNEKVYGNIGRFSLQKNQFFLIEIYEEILKIDQNAKFVIIGGNGPLYTQILEKVEKSIINEKTVILRDIKNVNEYYSAMDFFLLPSLFEGFAVGLVEAQASNLPCIISDQVSQEFKTNKMIFLPLSDKEKWVSTCITQDLVDRNVPISQELVNKFDIRYSYSVLKEYYQNLINKECEK